MPIFDSKLIVLTANNLDYKPFDLTKPPTNRIKKVIDNINIPMFKLSHEYKSRKYYLGKSSYMSDKIRKIQEIKATNKNSLLQYIINNQNKYAYLV